MILNSCWRSTRKCWVVSSIASILSSLEMCCGVMAKFFASLLFTYIYDRFWALQATKISYWTLYYQKVWFIGMLETSNIYQSHNVLYRPSSHTSNKPYRRGFFIYPETANILPHDHNTPLCLIMCVQVTKRSKFQTSLTSKP